MAESSMTQWKRNTPGEKWKGNIVNIEAIGLNTWDGEWNNSAGERKALHIRFNPDENKFTIFENPGNQTWISEKCEKKVNAYHIEGRENDEYFDFSAILELP